MYFITKANIIASQLFWENLSDDSQKKFCQKLAKIYDAKLSRHAIPHFCRRYKINQNKLEKYQPASNQKTFQSFQDFFTRKLVQPLKAEGNFAWPCEGYVCEMGKFSDLPLVNIKGNKINARDIFGKYSLEIGNDDTFVNIFLHNHNYHRFHAPFNGTVIEITDIKGKLLFLRPWFYQRKTVSFPSFLNERVILKIQDENNKIWHLCFVAGMGVGNIKIHDQIVAGSKISIGDEIGLFLLGSTCCIHSPYSIEKVKYMQEVDVGSPIKFT